MTYLDHAATTTMFPSALAAYQDAASMVGNASALHASGRRARRIVEESREAIAERLGASPSEVIFTSGGTEANNLAVKGLYWGTRELHDQRRSILVSGTEHHAVLDVVHWLQTHESATVLTVPVDEHGLVTEAEVKALVEKHADELAVSSIMWANNEVGTIQPVAALAQIFHEAGISFHSDAVQAVSQLDVDFSQTELTALSLTGHKLGGPVGVGALLLRRDAKCTPLLHGGGQERDVRSGTLDVAGVAAFAAAVIECVDGREAMAKRLTGLRDELVERVKTIAPDAILNGSVENRLPGNAHFSFPGCEGDALLMVLDAAGIECATGSACSAGVAQPSHVLLAMGTDERLARSSLRFSLGHTSTQDDVDALIAVLPTAIARASAAGMS